MKLPADITAAAEVTAPAMSRPGSAGKIRTSDSLRGFSDVLTEEMAGGNERIILTPGHASKERQTVVLSGKTSRAASTTKDAVQPEGVAPIASSLEPSAPASAIPSAAATLASASLLPQSLSPNTQLSIDGSAIPSSKTDPDGADQKSAVASSTLSSSESSKAASSNTSVQNAPPTGASGIDLTGSGDGHVQGSISVAPDNISPDITSQIDKATRSWSTTAGDKQSESSNVNLRSAAFVIQSGGQSASLSVPGLPSIPGATGPLLAEGSIETPLGTVDTVATDASHLAVPALPTALWPALAGTAMTKASAGRIVIPGHPQAAASKQGAEESASTPGGGIEGVFANFVASPVSVASLPVTAGNAGTPPESGSARAMASDPFTVMDGAAVDPLAEVMRATHHEVAVGMHDPTYGWVEIKSHLAGGQVTASLTTLSSDAHHVLQAQLPAMAEYLSSHDIHVDSLSLAETSAEARDASSGRHTHSQHGEQEEKLALQGVSAPARRRATENAATPRSEYRGTSRIDVMA